MLKKIKTFYLDKLKGKNITIRGKQIPLIMVFFISFLVGLVISGLFPTHCIDIKSKWNIDYIHNGIKVIGLKKCNTAICGYVQNESVSNYSNVTISLDFIKNDVVAYTNEFKLPELKSQSFLKIKIPSQTDFTEFKIKNVNIQK